MPYPEQHRYGPDKPLPSNLQIRAAAANISGNAHSSFRVPITPGNSDLTQNIFDT
ncbi:hypothetical protein Ac2012v2_006893 [Leucoagaricus gongylophorus]